MSKLSEVRKLQAPQNKKGAAPTVHVDMATVLKV